LTLSGNLSRLVQCWAGEEQITLSFHEESWEDEHEEIWEDDREDQKPEP